MLLSEGAARLLEARNILPPGYFCFGESPRGYYYLTPSLRVLDIDGQERPFSEDELWDGFELLERISREEFEKARARRGLLGGEVSREELKALSDRFAKEYGEHRGEKRWQFLCSYGEETIRRVTAEAVETLCRKNGVSGREKRREFHRVFREVIMARARRRIAPSSEPDEKCF